MLTDKSIPKILKTEQAKKHILGLRNDPIRHTSILSKCNQYNSIYRHCWNDNKIKWLRAGIRMKEHMSDFIWGNKALEDTGVFDSYTRVLWGCQQQILNFRY